MDNVWKVVLATVVIFGAGVGTGGLLVSHVDTARDARFRRPPGVPLVPSPRGVAGRLPDVDTRLAERRSEFLLSVSRQLSLTPQQSTNIEKVVRDGQERTKAIWSRVTPELDKEMAAVNASIRAELTPDQCTRFDELLKQGQRRRMDEPGMGDRGRGGRFMGPGGGPPRGFRFPGRSNGPPPEAPLTNPPRAE